MGVNAMTPAPCDDGNPECPCPVPTNSTIPLRTGGGGLRFTNWNHPEDATDLTTPQNVAIGETSNGTILNAKLDTSTYYNYSSDRTKGTPSIQLKDGRKLAIGPVRLGGQEAAESSYVDGWKPAGAGSVLTVLPRVNLYNLPDVNGRRVYYEEGTLSFDQNDVPQAELALAAKRDTTYFTTYDQESGTYFEYFAGSGLSSADARHGRLNRRYDTRGLQVAYNYSNNLQGRALLRSMTGDIGGNIVPYFYYADETIDSTHYAPITKVHLLDKGPSQSSRSIYFDYANYSDADGNSYPLLSRTVNPDGCVKLYDPVSPFNDPTDAYQIKRDVDPEGYQTYFTYGGTGLVRTTEPEGRITYYEYLSTDETRQTELGRPTRTVRYTTSSFGGHMPMITRDTDALGNTTYWTYDATLARMTRKIEPNGNLTYFDYVATGTSNQYAPARQISAFNNAVTYFGYNPGSYDLVKLVGPRHTDSFKVAAYYTYDVARNRTRAIDPLGNQTLQGYDSLGRLIRFEDARGVDTYFNYGTTAGGLDSKIANATDITYFGYDSYLNRTAEVSPRWREGGAFQAHTTYYVYDQLNRRTKTIDAQGGVTYFDYTSRSQLLDTVDELGTVTAFTYNGLKLRTQTTVTERSGALLSQAKDGYDIYKNRVRSQDGLGNATYYFYDAIDRLTAQVDALRNATYFTYDRVGKRTEETDARNQTTYYFYDPLSRQTGMRDALGNKTYYFYDLANNRTEEVDALGFTTYHFYDALNRTQANRDAVGNATYFFYDPVGNTSVQLDARLNPTYFFYDLLSRRNAVRDALRGLTYFGYDAANNQTRIMDARRNTTYFFYDTLNRQSVQRTALHESTYFFYDPVGNRNLILDARGNTTYFFHDGLRRPTAQKSALAESTYFFYDLAGNRTVTVDARASATYFFYDPLNRVAARRDAQANLTYFGYDSVSNQTRMLDARLNASYFTYDRLNRQDAAIDPVGNQNLSRFDAVGNLDAISRGTTSTVSGAPTYFFYDGARRRTAMLDALGGNTYYVYDRTSNQTRLDNPLAHSTYFGYDRLNRLVQVQDGVGGKTYFQYDAVGNQTLLIDPLARQTMTQYDSLNRVYAFRYPDTGSVYFFYDQVGNRTRERDPRANSTYFGYDAVNRLTRIQDALGRTVYYQYDPVGNRSAFQDAEGASISFTYDRLNRPTQLTFQVANAITSEGLKSTPYFVYDPVGNLTDMGDLWGLHRMGYDKASRLLQHQYPDSNVVYFSYDTRSNVTGKVYPGAAGTAVAEYDGLDRQTKLRSPSLATTYFTYDAASNLTRKVLGNAAKLEATYDNAERALQWRYTTPGNSPVTYFDYTRNLKGLITRSVREATHTVYYVYDVNDRLTEEIWRGATPEVYAYRYGYDRAGNRTRARMNGSNTYYFYDRANQLTVKGSNALYATPTYYTYDRNGSLTDEVAPAGTTKFAYNAAGLVARIRWRDTSSTYFFYDGALQRYAVRANGTLNYFLWDGLDVLQQRNADGTVKEEYTNSKTPIAGIGQLVETYRPSEGQPKIYPVMDPRGTIHKYMQSDGSTVLASREYDAFGQLIPGSSVGSWPGVFGYQGQAWTEISSADAAQRLLLSPTRLYDPSLGSFLSKDPLSIGNPAGVGEMFVSAQPHDRVRQPLYYPASPYTYTGGDPIGQLDSFGLVWGGVTVEYKERIDSWLDAAVARVEKRFGLERYDIYGKTHIPFALESSCTKCSDPSGACYKIVLSKFSMAAHISIATHTPPDLTLSTRKQRKQPRPQLPDYWLQEVLEHEMNHAAAAKRWHDRNEPGIRSDLNTTCKFKSKEECDEERKEIEDRYRQSWSDRLKKEYLHSSRNWRGKDDAGPIDFSKPTTPGFRPPPPPPLPPPTSPPPAPSVPERHWTQDWHPY